VWIVRAVLIFVGVFALLWLGMVNAGARVDFKLFTRSFFDVSINVILLVTFLAGMFFWFLIGLVNEIQLRRRIRKLRRETERLKQELVDLRNLPLQESVPEEPPPSAEEVPSLGGAR
jgi:uncharacterized integral membrane protein